MGLLDIFSGKPASPGVSPPPQGLMDLLLGTSNPISQFVDSRQNTLGAIGSGLAAGPTFAQGLSNAAQNIPQARKADYSMGLYRGQVSQTVQYLQQNHPDIAQAVQSGTISPADGMMMGYKLDHPTGIALNADQRLVNPQGGAPMGGAGQQGYRPLTDPAERAKFGIPSSDQTPYQVDPAGKLSYAGGPQSTVNINNTTENANAGEVGKWLGTKLTTLVDNGMTSQSNLANLTQLGSALAKSPTGWGADTVLAAKKALKSMGLDVGDVSSQELANTFTNKMALQMRNPAGGAGMPGSLSDADRNFLVSTMPNIGNTPQGNQKIIEVAKRMEQRSVDVSKLAMDYAQGHKGQLDINFFSDLAKWSAQHPLFADIGGDSGAGGGATPNGGTTTSGVQWSVSP